ncbi:DUF211 domain-containing protein [Pyrofollis japonicus]|nr:DUF211 domain-containing protein [Pyrofollis japonicus]
MLKETLSGLRRLVLDVLKPLKEPSIVDVALELSRIKGVDAVNITVNEVDVETLSLTVVIEGEDIDFESVKRVLEEVGAAIHSIDQVVAGKKIIEVPPKPAE